LLTITFYYAEALEALVSPVNSFLVLHHQ